MKCKLCLRTGLYRGSIAPDDVYCRDHFAVAQKHHLEKQRVFQSRASVRHFLFCKETGANLAVGGGSRRVQDIRKLHEDSHPKRKDKNHPQL